MHVVKSSSSIAFIEMDIRVRTQGDVANKSHPANWEPVSICPLAPAVDRYQYNAMPSCLHFMVHSSYTAPIPLEIISRPISEPFISRSRSRLIKSEQRGRWSPFPKTIFLLEPHFYVGTGVAAVADERGRSIIISHPSSFASRCIDSLLRRHIL